MGDLAFTNSMADIDQLQTESRPDVDDLSAPSGGDDRHPDRFLAGFGYLQWRPSWLQFLATARWFLFFMCVATFGQSMIVNGLIGVTISTIERRFALASSQVAWILVAYELAGIPALLIVGYIGSRVRRPRWIAGGMALLVVGILLYALPHFVAAEYRYTDDVSADNTCAAPLDVAPLNSTPAAAAVGGWCDADDTTSTDSSRFLGLFVVSTVLMGFGAVPLYVLGVTYMDDASPHGTAAVHIGIFYAFGVIGPVASFIGGGFLLKLYTHLDTVDTSTISLTDKDPRWVGAWWIGFLFSMCVVFTTVPTLLGFPSNPVTKRWDRKRSFKDSNTTTTTPSADNSSSDDLEVDLDLRAGGLMGVFKAVKSLLTNGAFVFSALYGTCDALLIAGFQAFGAKYFQQQFGLTPSMAGFMVGVVMVPGAAGGFIVGSYVIRRLSLTCPQLLRTMFILSLLTLFTFLSFFIQCDTAPFAGVTSFTDRQSPTDRVLGRLLRDNCSVNCGCSEQWFDPVCGADQLTYFSPCYAACQSTLSDTFCQYMRGVDMEERSTGIDGHIASSEYGNCTCMAGASRSANWSDVETAAGAVEGVCAVTSCQSWRLALFMILLFVPMFTICMCGIFHLSVILRVVEHSERPFAYALDWLLQRLADELPLDPYMYLLVVTAETCCRGGLPGPILFGFVLDYSCLLWERHCDDSSGACLYYDNHQMAYLMMAVAVACKSANIVLGLVAWLFYRHRHHSRPATAVEYFRSRDKQTGTGNGCEAPAEERNGVLGFSNPVQTSEL